MSIHRRTTKNGTVRYDVRLRRPDGGVDNRTFRLGDALSVRLPAGDWYALQVEKEQRWLPLLAPRLPLPVPVPVARETNHVADRLLARVLTREPPIDRPAVRIPTARSARSDR